MGPIHPVWGNTRSSSSSSRILQTKSQLTGPLNKAHNPNLFKREDLSDTDLSLENASSNRPINPLGKEEAFWELIDPLLRPSYIYLKYVGSILFKIYFFKFWYRKITTEKTKRK